MTIDQAFNHSAAYYDDWVQKALPNYAETFSVATEIIPFDPGSAINVLDLGAGTGLFSWHVLGKYPKAHFTLYDLAGKMLDVARERFQDRPAQFVYVEDDIRHLTAACSFDLAISSLSIHHLAHPEKLDLFKRVFQALKPGGMFINVDQIQGASSSLRELYWTKWLEKVRRNGAPEERIQESIQRRKTYDQDATLADQLRWLAEAGFADVDCIYKNYFIGIFSASKGQG